MTFAEILAAIEAASKAIVAVTGHLAAQEARLKALEAQVVAHDQALQHATPPGPLQKG